MKSKWVVTYALVGALGFSFLGECALANTIYSYSGDLFTGIVDATPPAGTYTTSMHVTGSITVVTPFAPNANFNVFFDPNVVSFSYSDGRNTLNAANIVESSSIFLIGTNSQGQINSWFVSLVTAAPVQVGDQQFAIFSETPDADQAHIEECVLAGCAVPQLFGFDGAVALNANTVVSGTWTITDTNTPLPATLPLFASGVGALGLLGWRKKQKAAAIGD